MRIILTNTQIAKLRHKQTSMSCCEGFLMLSSHPSANAPSGHDKHDKYIRMCWTSTVSPLLLEQPSQHQVSPCLKHCSLTALHHFKGHPSPRLRPKPEPLHHAGGLYPTAAPQTPDRGHMEVSQAKLHAWLCGRDRS